MSDALGSRHSETSPFGKLDTPLSLFISESTHEGLIALATSRGESKSEYVRRLLDVHVHGQVKIMQQACAKADPLTTSRTSEDARR